MAEEGAELEWEVGEAPERVLTKEERERRALFALMRPVASAAFELRAPLDWLKGAIQTATFAAGRSRGAGLREVGEALDVSISKVALLSRDFKQGMFGSDEGEALELHIERMLSAEPLTLARLNQVLPETSISDIEDALDRLEAHGRISCEGEGDFALYHLDLDEGRSEWDRLLSGIGGLRDALDVVAAGVLARAGVRLDADANANANPGVNDERKPLAGGAGARVRVPKEAAEKLLVDKENPFDPNVLRLFADEIERAGGLDDDACVEVDLAAFWKIEATT